jgi:pimeloyl-ACP methyl ester carboxylesterase
MADKITPNDSRIKRLTADLNGQTYAYIDSTPASTPLATIFLIHGFPDLSFGWRYQIPFLTSLGYRVIVPDMMGYGGSSAPDSPSFYTYKRAADDIAALAKHIGVSSIILGGHDWGGAVVYRVALWHPELISALFSVCTPFFPPGKEYVDMTVASNFKYQLQFRGTDVEREIVGEEKLRQFLNGMYHGTGPNGEPLFSVDHGVHFERLNKLRPARLASSEELDFYAKEYAKNGMHGPLNWYRTGELNFEDDRGIVEKFDEDKEFKFEIPVLFVAGSRDAALPPRISLAMDRWFKNLKRGEVDTSHWALTEKPAEVNQYLKDWLEEIKGSN